MNAYYKNEGELVCRWISIPFSDKSYYATLVQNTKTHIFSVISDETDPRHPHLSHMGLHDSKNDSSTSAGIPIPPSKPKIWSLADTAVCKTPPPSGGGAQSHLPPSSHHQQQAAHYQQPPPHSQSYLSSGLGGTNTSLAAASWGPNFSQFVDPAMMRLRHGNMLGMGYMGLPNVSQQSFSPLAPSAAAVAAAHVTASPGLNSDGVQSSSNDTPPQTPPTVKNQFGYNGNLHNGYSQMSPSSGANMATGNGGPDGGSASSKLLMFNSPMNTASSFKMMWNQFVKKIGDKRRVNTWKRTCFFSKNHWWGFFDRPQLSHLFEPSFSFKQE